MISFKQRHFKQDVILMLVRWYVAYALSYRDIEELAAERGLKVDHSTINRWVVHYSGLFITRVSKSLKNAYPLFGPRLFPKTTNGFLFSSIKKVF